MKTLLPNNKSRSTYFSAHNNIRICLVIFNGLLSCVSVIFLVFIIQALMDMYAELQSSFQHPDTDVGFAIACALIPIQAFFFFTYFGSALALKKGVYSQTLVVFNWMLLFISGIFSLLQIFNAAMSFLYTIFPCALAWLTIKSLRNTGSRMDTAAQTPIQHSLNISD